MKPKLLSACGIMLVLFISACAAAEPRATADGLQQPTSPPVYTSPVATIGAATASVTPGAENDTPGGVLLRVHVKTTSDWTNLFLVSGAAWENSMLISADKVATTAAIQGNQLILIQPIGRAEASESAEMTIEVRLSAQADEDTVVFKIERGNIGSTQVEFSSFLENRWVVIKNITWDGTTGDGTNSHLFEILAEEFYGKTSLVSVASQEPEATAIRAVTGLVQGTDGYPWWNNSVCYEIFVRSYFDSNGDGIGDINGITQKLDYLNDGNPATSTDLGVTCLWLMPIFPSPSYHGYNVTDFYTVNPQYGSLDDLINLVHEANSRGIRMIIDITLNHTSTQHPWFIEAENPDSTYHDWYIWSDFDPGYTGSWGQQVWFPFNDKFYYSTFAASFADLNFKNPAVNAEMEKVVRFWLEEVGVDGFRLDAAKHIIEEGTIQANTASTHAWWKWFRGIYKQINPQAFAVGEIWDTPPISAKYVQGDELDLSFDFYLAAYFINSVNEESSTSATTQMIISSAYVPPLQMAPFLTNHDQNRLMDQLGFDPRKVKVAASLLLTSPGMPFIYYGEEIGMEGQKPDEQIRRPMQWTTKTFAGFSNVSPWEPLGADWQSYNVTNETNDPSSILSHYRDLIQARNLHPALRVGDLNVLSTGNNGLYSILRVSQEEAVLVLINLTGEPISNYSLSIAQSLLTEGNHTAVAILGEGVFTPISTDSGGGFSNYVPVIEIPPYATFILRLQ